MGKVVAFKRGTAKRATSPAGSQQQLQQEGQSRGCISFTDMGDGTSRMKLSGSYANHLQFGLYAMITGLKGLVDRVVESGQVGHHSEGQIQESIKIGRDPPGRSNGRADRDDPM